MQVDMIRVRVLGVVIDQDTVKEDASRLTGTPPGHGLLHLWQGTRRRGHKYRFTASSRLCDAAQASGDAAAPTRLREQ